MKAKLVIFIMALACSIILISCIPGGGHYQKEIPAGFFSGVWHGWIAPVSLIFGIFDHNIRIYELNNTGWWYDFGFYIAIIGGFGGISLTRKKLKGKKGT
jgi:hypothetical protein